MSYFCISNWVYRAKLSKKSNPIQKHVQVLPMIQQYIGYDFLGEEYHRQQQKSLEDLIQKRKHEHYLVDGTTKIQQVGINLNCSPLIC